MELWVYCLLKVINKANVTKSGDGSMNLKLSDEFLYGAVTLVQGGELPLSSHLAVWVCEHLFKFCCGLCPCWFNWVGCIQDQIDPLTVPPSMYERTKRMLLHSSENLVDLILRQREHLALKQSRSSWGL